MIYIESNSTKPYLNLAYEEFFLKSKKFISEPVFMLWRNEPTVVVGRFQNTSSEVNKEFVDEKNINVIRRITGGGAVYHDFGTLCYTFISRNISVGEISFSSFISPLLETLNKFGVNGTMSGRNDLTIDGAKFSGTAMSLYKDSLLFHGTILYDTDLSILSNALNVREDKLHSKGIKSVKSRVTNILPYLKMNYDIETFKTVLKESMYKNTPWEEYFPNSSELEEIERLAQNKYKTWEWNYGQDPKAKVHSRKRFCGGEMEVYLDLENSEIKSCKIYGDFLGLRDIKIVEELLQGVPYERNAIRQALMKIDITEFFGTIRENEILHCLFQ